MKDCNYVDESKEVRDQFVYGISDEELKKNLLEKGTLLHEFKLHQMAKPMKLQNKTFKNVVHKNLGIRLPMLYQRISKTKFFCTTTVLTRKDLIVSLTKDTTLPRKQSANFVRSKITFKFPRNEND